MDTELRGPQAREQRRRAESTKIATRRARHGIVANAVIAAAGILALSRAVPPSLLLAWGGLLGIVSFGALGLLGRPPPADAVRVTAARRGFAIGALLFGATWGGLAFFVVARAAPDSVSVLFLLLSTLIIGAAYFLSPLTLSLVSFAGGVVIPVAAATLAFGRWSVGLESVLLLTACIGAVWASRRFRQPLDDWIDLRVENEHLTAIINLLHAEAAPGVGPTSDGGATSPGGGSRRQSSDPARAALDAASDAIIITDPEGAIRFLNPAAEALTGWSREEAEGKQTAEVMTLIDEATRQKPPDPVGRCTRAGHPIEIEGDTLLLQRGSPKEFLVNGTLTPVRGVGDETAAVVISLRNVTELASLDRLIAFQRIHDPLTGLLNRREFENQLRRASDSASGDGGPHALCSMGIDQFWEIHDNHGYAASDNLLRQFAAQLRPSLRRTDAPARLRADDFAILLRECDLDHARAIAENLRTEISRIRFRWETHPFEITTSIGVVALGLDRESPGELMHAANSARAVARDQGRNRVHLYQPDDAALLRRRHLEQWRQQVQQAVDEGRFQLFVQEISPSGAASNGVRHGEFLVRMKDDRGALVAPETFLEAAEQYNLMPAIDRWVVRNAIGAVRRRPPPLAGLGMCAINVSGQSLSDPGFLDQVLRELEGAAVAPEQICFEITETAVIEQLEHAQRFIRTLRGRGCRFALDDFGTGLSSFAYLKNLPVDYIKIDGGFVRGMVESEIDRAMVESINQIGHVLGMQTIAEYVEDEATLELVRRMGIDFAQGSLIGRPRPVG